MKRYFFYFVGLWIATLGVASVITSDMGAGPWDTVFVGLSNNIGLTPGNWVIIVGALLMIINAYLSKKQPDFPAFLTIFTTGVFVDINLKLLEFIELNNMTQRILLFIIGFILLIIGGGTYLQAKLAPNPIDNLMLVMHKKFGFSLAISRLLGESFAVLMGLLLSGPVSYGTVVVALFIGPAIQISYNVMSKIYNCPTQEGTA
ncbi:hypothetical protein EDC18_10240 [Natranaerovirga pectinivora]|uniref:Membrane protein YczE n=1 Tax=Natranaerovirga pectinivora TaxID=682400 RepID=A0A4R3MQ79_9FIRM|nr:membrane protein [Natranaerovirga pectinivora]TCT16026.1 hypothetical protein EDC18_10240 [Natranaerovirga pectinivora]